MTNHNREAKSVLHPNVPKGRLNRSNRKDERGYKPGEFAIVKERNKRRAKFFDLLNSIGSGGHFHYTFGRDGGDSGRYKVMRFINDMELPWYPGDKGGHVEMLASGCAKAVIRTPDGIRLADGLGQREGHQWVYISVRAGTKYTIFGDPLPVYKYWRYPLNKVLAIAVLPSLEENDFYYGSLC
jgi:hypothetical protein